MAVTIEIPTAFRRFTEGTPKFDCNATTIAEALNILTAQFPGLSRHAGNDFSGGNGCYTQNSPFDFAAHYSSIQPW